MKMQTFRKFLGAGGIFVGLGMMAVALAGLAFDGPQILLKFAEHGGILLGGMTLFLGLFLVRTYDLVETKSRGKI